MNGLYSWAISFTVCSFIVLIINYLFPKGNVKNTATVVLVLFCIISIISPLKQIGKKDMIIINETQAETDFINDGKVSAFRAQIRMLTDEALNEIGITDYELTIDASLNNDEIQINQFRIKIDKNELKDKAKNAVKDKTGIEPEIETVE